VRSGSLATMVLLGLELSCGSKDPADCIGWGRRHNGADAVPADPTG
jgi:hypothetical protein